MKAIILASQRGSIISSYTRNKHSIPPNYGCPSLIKRKLNFLKNVGIDELIVVQGLGFQKYEDILIDCHELEIRVNIIGKPFYKSTNRLVALWMAISEINDDVLFMNWDSVSKERYYRIFYEIRRYGILIPN